MDEGNTQSGDYKPQLGQCVMCCTQAQCAFYPQIIDVLRFKTFILYMRWITEFHHHSNLSYGILFSNIGVEFACTIGARVFYFREVFLKYNQMLTFSFRIMIVTYFSCTPQKSGYNPWNAPYWYSSDNSIHNCEHTDSLLAPQILTFQVFEDHGLTMCLNLLVRILSQLPIKEPWFWKNHFYN